MSREERRQYQRQMKSMERGPALPPAARARAERTAAKRAARKANAAPPGSFTTRFWVMTIVVAAVAGYIAFSLQWPQMPFALYAGLGTAAVALAIAVGFRYLQRRMARR